MAADRVLTVRSADRNDDASCTPVATGCPRPRDDNAVGPATEVPIGDTLSRRTASLLSSLQLGPTPWTGTARVEKKCWSAD